jgi:acetyl/propionyl-CoA carboxylase alpha subunit
MKESSSVDYTLRINDQTIEFTLESAPDGQLQVTAGDAGHEVSYWAVSPNHLRMHIDQAAVTAHLIEEDGETLVAIDGRLYRVCEHDEAREALSAGADSKSAPREVTPPMPAVVVRVLVEAGAAVAKGQPLVVVSAMKMETTLTAPFAARVVRVNTAEGDKVMPGEILVDLEAEEPLPEQTDG